MNPMKIQFGVLAFNACVIAWLVFLVRTSGADARTKQIGWWAIVFFVMACALGVLDMVLQAHGVLTS